MKEGYYFALWYLIEREFYARRVHENVEKSLFTALLEHGSEYIGPIGRVFGRRFLDTSHSDFPVLGAHDISAMPGATEPSVHGLSRAALSSGYVFTHCLPRISNGIYAVGNAASVAARMTEKVVFSHIDLSLIHI